MGVKTLSCSDYLIRGRYSEKPLIRAFGSWNSALAAAGLVVGKRAKIKDEDLFDNITRMWQTLGRQPRYREVEPPLSEVSVGTYEHRFGSWRKALEAFVQSVSVGSATERPQPQESPVVKARPQRRRATRRNPNWRMRYLVLSRDGFRCVLCGASPATAHGVKLHVDHITPWSKGGETILSNLRTCCEQCNIGRSNLDASPLTV
ncbi:MAG: HNH endonuclease [Tepidisphaeraceae bacterium]|jgi:5-methylcytosine-specific restriction endonuclease McrA